MTKSNNSTLDDLSIPLGKDGRIVTQNKMGWALPASDPVTKGFVDHCATLQDCHVLEIGAAYGHASIMALKAGARIWVNDLDHRHLDRFSEKTADNSRVTLVPGDYPDELSLPLDFFDAILSVRVFHFFSPEKLERSVNKLFQILKSEGKVFLLADTPYQGAWTYWPEYERKKEAGEPYPGYFSNLEQYNLEGSAVTKHLPKYMHFLDPDVLSRVFQQMGFEICESKFLNRQDYPPHIRLDGRESVGIVARKP
jgi:SAM-dependent methyltransferase